MKRLVIALGGNALQQGNGLSTAAAQAEAVRVTAYHLADILERGYEITITHGNGPQVGRIIMQNEIASPVTPAMPFDVCGAMSQGMIGYHIQQALEDELRRRGMERPVVTLITRVVVDRDDPAFKDPTKPIGIFYTRDEAKGLESEKGYIMKEDAGRGWRRVVASPYPLEIVEIAAIRALIDAGVIVITVGGGGIPVIRNADGSTEGVPAVIDKDYASERLAEDIDADGFMILTAVEKAYINFGKPDQKALNALTAGQAEEYIQQHQFASGSMLPKIKAAITFAESKKGRKAVITSLDRAEDALKGITGTTIIK